MNHEESNGCALCEAEFVELYRVKHGVHLPSLEHLTIPQKLEFFKMDVSHAPDWTEEDPGLAGWLHYLDHFEEIAYKTCPLGCKTAKRDSGEGTCELCCKERALRKHLGDAEVRVQIRATRKMWREIAGF